MLTDRPLIVHFKENTVGKRTAPRRYKPGTVRNRPKGSAQPMSQASGRAHPELQEKIFNRGLNYLSREFKQHSELAAMKTYLRTLCYGTSFSEDSLSEEFRVKTEKRFARACLQSQPELGRRTLHGMIYSKSIFRHNYADAEAAQAAHDRGRPEGDVLGKKRLT